MHSARWSQGRVTAPRRDNTRGMKKRYDKKALAAFQSNSSKARVGRALPRRSHTSHASVLRRYRSAMSETDKVIHSAIVQLRKAEREKQALAPTSAIRSHTASWLIRPSDTVSFHPYGRRRLHAFPRGYVVGTLTGRTRDFVVIDRNARKLSSQCRVRRLRDIVVVDIKNVWK
jgi:hypothetical protein